MRYSIALSALAATALAQAEHGQAHQKHHKRDGVVETDLEYVYQTVVVTQTVFGASPTAAPVKVTSAVTSAIPSSSAIEIVGQHFGASSESSSAETTTSSSSTAAASSSSSSQSFTGNLPSIVNLADISDSPSGPSQGYKDIVLLHHNIHRANHSANPLTWSDDLYQSAQQLASTCSWQENAPNGVGQNIGQAFPANQVSLGITNLMYNAELPAFGDQWGQANPVDFLTWGHMSQIIWGPTTEVACTTWDCSGVPGNDVQNYFTVCNYSPAGNVDGWYGKDMSPPLGHPSITQDWAISS